MRNALSIFFITLLFSMTIGIGNRFNTKTHQAKVSQHIAKQRDVASITDNTNCFTIAHLFLQSHRGGSGRRLFKSPLAVFRNWRQRIAQYTKFNWEGFTRGGFKIDYDKVSSYREIYARALGNNRSGFEGLAPNSLNIDRNPESILGFIYAFNRHEARFHWLDQADIQDLGIWSRRRLHELLDKVLTKKEFSRNEYDDLMQEMMWKLFGKRSKELMDGIIDEHTAEAGSAVKEAISRNIKRGVYETYVREMSSMALEKTTLFMTIRKDKRWWARALQSSPAQLIFSSASWYSLLHGLPFLPWFVDTMPRLARHKFSYEAVQKLITQGPTQEFFNEATEELSKKYGKDWAFNTFFLTNSNYEKFRVRFQKYVAPLLPLIAIYYEYTRLTQEFAETGAEIDTLDALNERYHQTIEQMAGLKDFGIVLVDAYIPEEPYQIPEDRLTEMEERREAHNNRACRQLKSCLVARMQQMMDQMDPSLEREMDIEQEMLDVDSDHYKFCKRIRDRNDECTFEQLSIIVHSMIE